ncbi:MAG: hypothetical protein R3300_20415 [Candidatus Promineifilaceae bacterium]|nr:hypothetical protein [Candidatus Promineifilaceae bacterium]
MSSMTNTIARSTDRLARWLRLDGAFISVTSAAVLVGADPLSDLFELGSPVALRFLGLVLLPYAGLLFYLSGRTGAVRTMTWVAAGGNLIWVLVSYIGLLLGWFPVNTAGKWTIGLLAEAIFLIAAAQVYILWKTRHQF